MEPIGHFQRVGGEYVLLHRCMDCGLERFNRIAADDDFDLVLSLLAVEPRTKRQVKAQQLESWLDEQTQEPLDWNDVEAG